MLPDPAFDAGYNYHINVAKWSIRKGVA